MAEKQKDAKPTDPFATTVSRFANRIFLIGLDGADLDTLRSLIDAGRLPHLSSLVREGVTLELAVPRPAFAQAAWTSLATGKRPHEHGVLHALEQAAEGSELQPVKRHTLKCKPLWKVLQAAGLRTHVMGWPVTHPADLIEGVCLSDQYWSHLPETLDVPQAGPSVMPPEVTQVLSERRMAPHQVEDITLAQLLPSYAVGLPEYARLEAMCRDILAQTATLFRAIRWSLDAQPWDFATCIFPGIRRCHELANWLRRISPASAELCKSMLSGCYEHHDLLLGQLLSQMDGRTQVIVLSAFGNAVATPTETYDKRSLTHSIPNSASRNHGLAVLFGPGVKHHPGIQSCSILDVNPTILTLLGVPYGEDMGGRPLTNLFENGFEPQTIPTWETHQWEESIETDQYLTVIKKVGKSNLIKNQEVEHLIQLGYTDPLEVAASEAAMHCQRTTTFNRAISLMDAGFIDRAIDVLEQLTSQYPDWYQSRSLLAEAYHRGRHRVAARKEIDWLYCHGFENPRLYLLSAAVEAADRKFSHALDELNCTRRGQIAPYGSALMAGNFQLRKLNFAEAEKSFLQSIEHDGISAAALDGLAAIKLHLGEHEDAAVYALDALERNMGLGKAHYHLAVALYFLNKPQESLKALASWIAVEPYAAAPYRWMARVHRLLLKNLPLAENCLHRGRAVVAQRRHFIEKALMEDTLGATYAP